MPYLIQPPASSIYASDPSCIFTTEILAEYPTLVVQDLLEWGWSITIHRPNGAGYLAAIQKAKAHEDQAKGGKPRLTIEEVWRSEKGRRVPVGFASIAMKIEEMEEMKKMEEMMETVKMMETKEAEMAEEAEEAEETEETEETEESEQIEETW